MMLEILVRASVEGAIVVGTIWVVCRLLPRLSPATRTVLWWCAAAKFVLALVWTVPVHIPILPASVTAVEALQVSGVGARTASADAVVPHGATAASGAAASAPPGRWAVALAIAWLAGVVVSTGIGVRRWKQMARVIARSSASAPGTAAIAAELASHLGLMRVPRVRVSDDLETPLVTGMFRPVILLPAAGFDALSDRQQRLALCHELTHIKRHDLWLGCVPAVAERVFFFHPLVHLAAREYALCREAACDAHVLAALDAAPQEYGRLLLGLGISRRRASLAAAGAPWSFSTLRRRIAMLDSPSSRSTGSRVVAAIVIGIAALAIAPLRLGARPAAVDLTIDSRVQSVPDNVAAASLESVTTRVGREKAPSDGAAQKQPELNYVMFEDRDSTTMSGSERDIVTAARYRRGGERLLWFREGSHEYVIRDPELLDRVVELWRPVQELGEQQGILGTRQGELGTEQGHLGTLQGEVGTQQGRLGTEQGILGTRQGVMAERERTLRTDAERRAFDDERRRIEREMRALDEEMRKLNDEMREYDKPMQDLGRQMEVLGKEMEALGRRMEEESRKAESGMRELLRRAISTGAAEVVQ
jgi:beta-lactamase regulating signal transducer with metallopeptidase domain